MAATLGVNHIAFATGRLDETLRFWRDLIGLRLVGRFGAPGYRQYFLDAGAGALLSFLEWPGVGPVAEKDHGVPIRGPFAFDHVAFTVETEEELWSFKDRLDAAAIWVSEVIDHGFIRSVYAFDPNNIPIEFACPVPGVDLAGHPRLVDRSPGEAAGEGPDPQPGHWPRARPTPAGDRRTYPGSWLEHFPERR